MNYRKPFKIGKILFFSRKINNFKVFLMIWKRDRNSCIHERPHQKTQG